MINCVVVFGGDSCEHDISIVTGCQTISKLNEYLYNVIPVYIDKKGNWLVGKKLADVDNYPDNIGKTEKVGFVAGDNRLYTLKHNKLCAGVNIDMAFICLHGGSGEDGTVASVFKLSKIPYSCPDVLPSSISLDKSIFKIFCKGLGVDVVEGIYFDYADYVVDNDAVFDQIKLFGLPVIIKPARQGSSVGIEVCKDEKTLKTALNNAFLYDSRILVERYVDMAKEINIALFKSKGDIVFSQTEEPKFTSDILSFNDKYLKNPNGFEGISREMPANIDKELEEKIKSVAEKIYKTLKVLGVVRFDFIYTTGGELFVNEVNTIPGSLANYLFDGISFGEMLDKIRADSVYEFDSQKRIAKEYNSGFLKTGCKFIKK